MTAKTPAAVSQSVRDKLRTTLPGLSMEIGSVERKIVDACSEAVSEAYLDQYVTGSLLDIDTKAGIELEAFVGIFGFGRLEGRKATGIVRMEVTTAATQSIEVQRGTQFYVPYGSATNTALYFASTQPAIMAAGVYSVDIPVECTVAGTIGNVAPGSITSQGAAIGAASVTNLTAMTGGIDTETDAELRQRFRATFLRNIAGTEDFYHAICLQNKYVSKVAVYGPVSLYRTQIAAPSSNLTIPASADVKYVWKDSQSVYKNLGTDDEEFYTPGGIDYTFTGGSSASIVRNASGTITAGDIIDVEFEYTTRASRNDPVNGITNKVDIFVNGSDPYVVTERTIVSSQVFSTSAANDLYTGNFTRVLTATAPSSANRFMRLGSTPISSFPSTLVIGGTTYTEGTHYWRVRSTTLLAGSEREISGIEWAPSGPASNTQVTLTYSYNRVPEMLNAIIKNKKQITTDVLVHEAAYRYLRVYLSVEYDRNMVVAQVNTNIQVALRNFFSNQRYGAMIEISDLVTVVHQVNGVDNVWLTTTTENATNYGIRVYDDATDVTPLATQTTDFMLTDNQLPVFLDAVITRKANAR
jgi:uncharacterized phage protein gp47/JayE